MKTLMIKNKYVLGTLKQLLIWISFVASIGFASSFAFYGVASFFGEEINFVTAIDLIFSIIYINDASTYISIAGAGLGIYFFIALIAMVKNIINSATHIDRAMKTEMGETTATPISIVILMDNFGHVFHWIISFTVIARLLSRFSANSTLISILILGTLIYLFLRVAIYILKYRDLTKAIYQGLVCNLIYAACLAVLMFSVCNIQIEEFFRGFGMMGTMFETGSREMIIRFIFELFVKIFCLFVIQMKALGIISDLLSFEDHLSVEKNKVKFVMGWSIALIAISMFVSFYGSNSIWGGMKGYLSCLICSIALLLTYNIPRYKAKQTKATVSYTNDNPNVVEPAVETTYNYSAESKNEKTYTVPVEDEDVLNDYLSNMTIDEIMGTADSSVPEQGTESNIDDGANE